MRQLPDPIYNSASLVTSGSIEHSALGGPRFLSGHTPNSARQVISSPLAKLSMSSSLEEGAGGGAVSLSRTPKKRHTSETSVESSRGERGEDSLMESDGETGLEESVEANACGTASTEKVLQT